MLQLKRFDHNPILLPSMYNNWESSGTFNGTVVKHDNNYIMLYRALSEKVMIEHNRLNVSTIGISNSMDGKKFLNTQQFIVPEFEWEAYGCEDPRVTKIDDTYYIFYTALSSYPFNADNIKVAVALTKDFKTIIEKHLVTPFNAKAMALFPEKINGKYAVIVSANTDIPPSKIGIALLDQIEELWSTNYWNKWYAYLDDHVLPLKRSDGDQVEVGAQPVLTNKGWLMIYSYIKNYYSNNKTFCIEAALLEKTNPKEIIARSMEPLLIPEKEYEKYGLVSDVIFPSGALLENETLSVYYGGADTSTCIAFCNINELLNDLKPEKVSENKLSPTLFSRFEENPIMIPIAEHKWENKAVFNPTAIYEAGKFHILYRAMGEDNTSVIGYAFSMDGYHIDERLPYPVYVPRESFESKSVPNCNSGCEDPRVTKIDDKFYIFYTAYDGTNPPRVAMSSILVDDFLKQQWNWEHAKLISLPGIDDKDTVLFPKKINGKYVFVHRLGTDMWIVNENSLEEMGNHHFLAGNVVIRPRKDKWDSKRIGVSSPPIETDAGWILLYHGYADDAVYKVSALLLDKKNPSTVLARLDEPIFVPEKEYEKVGQIPNVVFPCGAVVNDQQLFLFYGGADSVVAVASMPIKKLLNLLLS